MERGIWVLHVDDDPAVPELARKFLKREDERLTVECVSDAEAGIERLTDGEFDCVVSDYEMPGTDGIEFLEAVREEYPELPFVLFTGKGSEAVASEAISAGVTDYLQKGAGTEQFELLANRITNAVSQARSERQLAAERRRFQLLFERLSQPTVEVEYEGGEPVVRRVNPAFEETFGYAEDDVVGESLDAYIVPEEYREEAEAINDRVREGGRLESEAVTRLTADGEREFLLQNAAYSDGSGGFAIYSDVTDRDARERQLKRSLDLLRHTERLAGTGGWELDVETREVHWTDGAYAVHGVDSDSDFEPTLSSILELYHPEDRDRIQRTIASIPQGEEPSTEELRLLPRDGRRRWIRVGGEPVTDDGEVVALRGAIEDITERKERERELRRQNERLEAFASVVSHDLRNPLTVAKGRLELARTEEDGADEDLEAVAEAHERMETLIEDLLALARSGQQVDDLETVDLASVAEDCYGNVDTEAATLVADTTATVRADESRLQQLFENLFRNAIEHGATSGPPSAEDDSVTITVGDLGDDAGFYVADDGTGIPADERERVFESGFSTAEEGTGFGLTIAREIAEAHGWELTVTESAAGGARFEVTGVDTAT
ncbi:hybrid sensor histidine kinase/response regulator [Natronomonas marina]|uniref:hybrid sensor histidine kinase/response regulator n=1 Tax=Natronomonas marina TaxID=2961939 RepID=UPI0020C99F31|nr:PAS domain S-box protein [Natronomonas marina]